MQCRRRDEAKVHLHNHERLNKASKLIFVGLATYQSTSVWKLTFSNRFTREETSSFVRYGWAYINDINYNTWSFHRSPRKSEVLTLIWALYFIVKSVPELWGNPLVIRGASVMNFKRNECVLHNNLPHTNYKNQPIIITQPENV